MNDRHFSSWGNALDAAKSIASNWDKETLVLDWILTNSYDRAKVDTLILADVNSPDDAIYFYFYFHMTPTDKKFITHIIADTLMNEGVLVGGDHPILGTHIFKWKDERLRGIMDESDACIEAIRLGCKYETICYQRENV